MSFKDLLILSGDLAFGGTFSVHGSFRGYMERECFYTANTMPLQECLAFGMICTVHKKREFPLCTLNVIMDVFA